MPRCGARLGAAAAATPGLLDDAEVAEAHADFYREVIEAVRVRSTRGRRAPEGFHDEAVRRTPSVSAATSRA